MINKTLETIEIEKIHADPKQPRKHFDQDKLNELAETIKERGLKQPIIVEPDPKGGYLLVMGERRLRALRLVGKKSLVVGQEVIIRDASNHGGMDRFVDQIIENDQRENLNCIETANSYGVLRDVYKLSVPEISKKLGKSQAVIYNFLNLLDAEQAIQDLWAERKLTHEPKAVNAILSVPTGEKRVKLALGLAAHGATRDMIISACRKFNEVSNTGGSKKKRSEKTPANDIVTNLSEHESEWNALFQLGRVPPFALVNDVVLQTCDECSLRNIASEFVCGDCALVCFLRGIEREVVHA